MKGKDQGKDNDEEKKKYEGEVVDRNQGEDEDTEKIGAKETGECWK